MGQYKCASLMSWVVNCDFSHFFGQRPPPPEIIVALFFFSFLFLVCVCVCIASWFFSRSSTDLWNPTRHGQIMYHFLFPFLFLIEDFLLEFLCLPFLTRTGDSFASYTLGIPWAHLASFLCWISYFWIQSCLLSWLISLCYWGITSHSFLSKGLREIVLKLYPCLKMYIFCPQSWLIFWLGIEFSGI